MNRIKQLALLLVLLIICNSLCAAGHTMDHSSTQPTISLHPSFVYAASPNEEGDKIYGKVVYHARGPAMYATGFTAAFLLALHGYVEMGQFQDTLADIRDLFQQASQQQQDGSGSDNDFSNGGDRGEGSLNLADIPYIGYHEITLDFILEEQSDEAWKLESGFIEWRGASEGQIGTLTQDSFFDYGYQALDPEKDRINLKILPSAMGTFEEYELDINVTHPYTVSGSSTFYILLYLVELIMTIEANEGNVTVSVDFPIQPGSGPVEGLPKELPFEHVGRGIFRSDRTTNYEAFTAPFGTSIMIETELERECRPRIVSPDTILTFDDSMPGVLEFTAEAVSLSHDANLDDLVWIFPEIEGSTLYTDPEDRRGPRVDVKYTGLPTDNNQFGEKEIEAYFDTETRCKDPEPLEVKFLFCRDSNNHPGPDRDMPNWFYYWRQTSAAQGEPWPIVYGGDGPQSNRGKDYVAIGGYRGYIVDDHSHPDANRIYIYDLANVGFRGRNPVTGTRTEGIDLFAATVIHEYTHLRNYHRWWAPEGYWSRRDDMDKDGDFIPDRFEPGLGFDPTKTETHKPGIDDEEYIAYRSESSWIIGSANSEDWANPGKNSGGGN